MPYKISGTKSATARILIFKESDWSIESNTVVSGSGAYEIDVETGVKTIVAETTAGEMFGYGNVTAFEYTLPSSNRGIFAGGWANSDPIDDIDYIAISTAGDAQDFGNLTTTRQALAGTSNGTNNRGVFGGGFISPETNRIDYIPINTPTDSVDFGDLTVVRYTLAAVSNGTNERGCFAGGRNWAETRFSTIDYITINSTGNATSFGALIQARKQLAGTDNATNDRGIFAGGDTGTVASKNEVNTIDYITISSTGTATNFGDLTLVRRDLAATSNGINNRAVFGGGYYNSFSNIIDYVNIQSTSDAFDFGDLSTVRQRLSATSNGTNNRGVFAGGDNTNFIEYITISNPGGTATNFGNLTSIYLYKLYMSACSNA